MLTTHFFISIFSYFCLTIQNTADRHVSNAFGLIAVFISFPVARCAPPPHPAPHFWGREVPKKSPVASVLAFGHVCVGVGVVKVTVRCEHYTGEI